MIVLDTTIVTVALPSMAQDMMLSDAALGWLVTAYMLPFGGLLMIAGGCGDVFGKKQVFITGLAVFTLASLAAGVSRNLVELLAARITQGIAAALVSAVSLALVAALYRQPGERSRALGIYGAVCAAGGAIGEVLGGGLTTVFNWHWVFLVNVPVGLLVLVASVLWLPTDANRARVNFSQIAGGVVITAAAALLIYSANEFVDSAASIAAKCVPLASAIVLVLTFTAIQAYASEPLLPRELLAKRTFLSACCTGTLWSASIFAWLVLGTLDLQRVFFYDALRVGLAFLPASVFITILSGGLSGKLAELIGLRAPACVGMAASGAGLALLALTPAEGAYASHILPGMILFGIGTGMTSTPLFLAAMSGVEPTQTGIASGVFNTCTMLGGSVGTAVAVCVAAEKVHAFQAGVAGSAVLHAGYQSGLWLAAFLCLVSAILANRSLPKRLSTGSSVQT